LNRLVEAVSAAVPAEGVRVRPIFAALMLVMLLASLDSTTVSTALATIAAQMTQARCDEIRELVDEWQPPQHPEVVQLIERFARSLSSAPPLVGVS
jgi:hypothetical protein